MEGAPAQKDINAELADLYAADQKDRAEQLYQKDHDLFLARDQARMARARGIYEQRQTAHVSPEGLFNLAMLFQHGEGSDDYLKAWNLAKESEAAGYTASAWLTAAAEDRYLLSLGQKQKWGTQFNVNKEGELALLDMSSDEESGVTDEVRAAKGISTRAEKQEELKEMTKKMKEEQAKTEK